MDRVRMLKLVLSGILLGASQTAVAKPPIAGAHIARDDRTGDCQQLVVNITPRSPEDADKLLHISNRDVLKVQYVNALAGPCSGAVVQAMHDLVSVSGKANYRLPNVRGRVVGGRLIPSPDTMRALEPEGLEEAEIPVVAGFRFIAADDYMKLMTSKGMEYRYVGLWSDGKTWSIQEFTVPAGGQHATKPKQLLESRYPIRGLSFLPSPDTPSGQIWLVQEGAAGETLSTVISWFHGGVTTN